MRSASAGLDLYQNLRGMKHSTNARTHPATIDKSIHSSNSTLSSRKRTAMAAQTGGRMILPLGIGSVYSVCQWQALSRCETYESVGLRGRGAVSALAEMYVQGVSTRKVKAMTEELCGHTSSAGIISLINTSLDGVLRCFAERRLDEASPYLILDARYEKVRIDGVNQTRTSSWRSGSIATAGAVHESPDRPLHRRSRPVTDSTAP